MNGRKLCCRLPRFALLFLSPGISNTTLGIAAEAVAQIPVARFSKADLGGWETESFDGDTEYRFEAGESNRSVLCARSQAAASGLIRKIQIALDQTPYLNWSWRIDQALPGHDERTKHGDDFAARVYVVIDDGVFFWHTKALNYVWASRAPVGSSWNNPFAGNNVKMIAIESGSANTGIWKTEKRNVVEDLKTAFKTPFMRIDAVAIMTDTDNTALQARACYGDIFFSGN